MIPASGGYNAMCRGTLHLSTHRQTRDRFKLISVFVVGRSTSLTLVVGSSDINAVAKTKEYLGQTDKTIRRNRRKSPNTEQ